MGHLILDTQVKRGRPPLYYGKGSDTRGKSSPDKGKDFGCDQPCAIDMEGRDRGVFTWFVIQIDG